MSRIVLRSLHYERGCEIFGSSTDLREVSRDLGNYIGSLVSSHASGGRTNVLLCSTTICDLFYDRPDLNAGLRDAFEAACDRRIDQIISTYECASWGYAFRYAARNLHWTDLTLVIMDLNLPHFEFWNRDHVWGRSGHGVLIAHFSLSSNFVDELEIGCGADGQALLTFGRALQQLSFDKSSESIFVPFLTSKMQRVMDGLPVRARLAPNLYADFGHCFGSDPWIGLKAALDTGQPVERALVGSFALNGYYCIARIAIAT